MDMVGTVFLTWPRFFLCVLQAGGGMSRGFPFVSLAE